MRDIDARIRLGVLPCSAQRRLTGVDRVKRLGGVEPRVLPSVARRMRSLQLGPPHREFRNTKRCAALKAIEGEITKCSGWVVRNLLFREIESRCHREGPPRAWMQSRPLVTRRQLDFRQPRPGVSVYVSSQALPGSAREPNRRSDAPTPAIDLTLGRP